MGPYLCPLQQSYDGLQTRDILGISKVTAVGDSTFLFKAHKPDKNVSEVHWGQNWPQAEKIEVKLALHIAFEIMPFWSKHISLSFRYG